MGVYGTLRKTLPKPLRVLLQRMKRCLLWLPYYLRGTRYAREWTAAAPADHLGTAPDADLKDNPLWAYFRDHETGRGIWKWKHYFPIYHRYFKAFVRRPVTVLEIGVYSGGSIDMWQHYFGAEARIHGVDIEAACVAYATESVSITIGDQADPAFWASFFERVGPVDIVIDDGGHEPHQQRATLEATLPHLNPGGIYLCEDIDGFHHSFTAYASGLVNALNHSSSHATSPFQADVDAIHFYPNVMVIERRKAPCGQFASIRKGTEWEPFFDD